MRFLYKKVGNSHGKLSDRYRKRLKILGQTIRFLYKKVGNPMVKTIRFLYKKVGNPMVNHEIPI